MMQNCLWFSDIRKQVCMHHAMLTDDEGNFLSRRVALLHADRIGGLSLKQKTVRIAKYPRQFTRDEAICVL